MALAEGVARPPALQRRLRAWVLPLAPALVARRAGGARVRFWGLVRPGSGRRDARITVLDPGGAWREIARGRTHADGTFMLSADVDPSRTFRRAAATASERPVAGAR